MTFGPEMVSAWSTEISTEFKNKKVTKIDFGHSWIVMQFANYTDALFFSLDPQYYGVASISKSQGKMIASYFAKTSRVEQSFKKHLLGGVIIGCNQINHDRILTITFEKRLGAGFAQKYSVIFEIMAHKSNLILADSEQRVIDAVKLKSFDSKSNSLLLPGTRYSPPPPLSGVTLSQMINDIPSVAPERIVGIGKNLEKKIKELWHEYPKELWHKWLSNLRYIHGNIGNVTFQKLGNYITFFPVLLPGAEPIETHGSSALKLAREFVFYPFLQKETTKLKNEILKPLKTELKSYKARIEGLNNLIDMAKQSEEWIKIGNLLIAWQHNIPPKTAETVLEDWTTTPPQKIRVNLDPQKSPVENAQTYFKKAKKYKDKNEEAQKLLMRYKTRYEELKETIESIESLEEPTQILALAKEQINTGRSSKSKHNKTSPVIRYDLRGAIVFAGLNQKSNHYVTFKLAQSGDIWLHAKDKPGAHVVIRKTDTKEKSFSPDDPRLIFAASLAAYHSKGRSDNLVVVDYTEKKHVAPQKGGIAQVTYSNYKSISVSPVYWKKYLEEQI